MFIITVASFLIYLTGFTEPKGEFHGTIANIFLITSIVHLIFNLKKFLSLFKGTFIREGTLLYEYVSGTYTPKAEAYLLSLFRRGENKK
jgi:hypothetical protein